MSDRGPGPYCTDGTHCSQKERIAELERQNAVLNTALWNLAGKAARLEFGDDYEHIDRMQTAVYAEALGEASDGLDETQQSRD